MRAIGLGAAVMLTFGCTATDGPELSARERLRQATVTVGEGRCAGVLLECGDHALTAAHCIPAQEREVRLEVADGMAYLAAPEVVDRGSDLALLRLEVRAQADGLELGEELPSPGDVLLFAGRPAGPSQFQVARVQRLGRCPTLPEVPNAVFTTLRGHPGDSGAPLVDSRMRVVALVHGGAACSIAAPTAQVPELLRWLVGPH
jgi:S1-C subfamily serine protease